MMPIREEGNDVTSTFDQCLVGPAVPPTMTTGEDTVSFSFHVFIYLSIIIACMGRCAFSE